MNQHDQIDEIQAELIQKIQNRKSELGKKLLVLTHHYQRKEIVALGDYKGDSFTLSKKSTEDVNVTYIIFCGVHFMAESAAILAKPHQIVQIPDMEAGCWMADMLDHVQLSRAWEDVTNIIGLDQILPVVYVNSDAYIKAFCGHHGGLTCTSSNAGNAFEWCLERASKIFFFPDQHLGRNTALSIGIPEEKIIVWNPEKPLGGNTKDSIQNAKIILWHGYCLVHTRFKIAHIEQVRKNNKDVKVVVHPECEKEVVQAADAVGSTGFIEKYVKQAPVGSTIAIGTEINFINRLGLENPEKKILPLHHSLCPNMYKINLENLLKTIENVGVMNVITIPDDIKKNAKTALEKMLLL